MAAGASSAAPPLAKYLASTDKKTRDKAIAHLSEFLSAPERDALPAPEMAKLWKGIFYCFWMSDKPLVQQALATELAELLLRIAAPPAALAFLRGFWEATVREWNGIDRLRMDKFYMLVRRFVNAAFRLLRRARWAPEACAEYADILSSAGGPLCADDGARVPPGLTYHIADVYLEELEKALAMGAADDDDTATPAPAPLGALVQPFLALAARTPAKATYTRIQEAVLAPLFADLLAAGAVAADTAAEDGDEAGGVRAPKRARLALPGAAYPAIGAHASVDAGAGDALPPAQVRRALRRRVFEVASAEATRDANRRRMYAFWKGTAVDDEDEDGEDGEGPTAAG